MRFVFMSDTHTVHDLIRVPDGDVLVHAGDFTAYGRTEEILSFARFLRSLPHKHKIVIAGNHDVSFERTPDKAKELLGDSCTYLNNSGVSVDGISVWGSPWTPWFDDMWAFQTKTKEEREKTWGDIPEGTQVLVTHGPPFGVLDKHVNGELLGDVELLSAVEKIKPKVHVFGHIHENGGKSEKRSLTTFINASILDENYKLIRGPVVVDL